MRIYLVVLLCLPLSGCWFIYLPNNLFQEGNACVREDAYVGQRTYDAQTAKYGKVEKLIGRSDRCQQAAQPILATVEYE